MGFLNAKLPSGEIGTWSYTEEKSAYIFEEDLVINGWIIQKIVTYSTQGWNRDHYLEFVIKDKCGISRIYWEYVFYPDEIRYVRHFIQESLIFKCEGWADFDIAKTFVRIKEILDSNRSRQEQLTELKDLLNS